MAAVGAIEPPDKPPSDPTSPADALATTAASANRADLSPEQLVEELARDMVLRGSSGEIDGDAAREVMARAAAAARELLAAPAPVTGENPMPAVARTHAIKLDPAARAPIPASRPSSGPYELTAEMKIDPVTPEMMMRASGENPVPAVARTVSSPYELTPEMKIDPVTPDMLLRASGEQAVPAVARTVSGSHLVTPDMLVASMAAPPSTPMEAVAQVGDELVPGVAVGRTTTAENDLLSRARRLSQQLQAARVPTADLDLRPPLPPRTVTPLVHREPEGRDTTVILVIVIVAVALAASIVLLVVAW
jgi:hypothetical protein